MPLKIVRESDPVIVKQVVLLIYGQPGRGKTSLGQTADVPLTLDFDNGIHRSAFRKDAVLVDDWTEVATMTRDELQGYRTVVVDTVGRCLDKITAHLIRTNPKLAQSSGALTLQGYGELKATFMNWCKMLKEMGVDVVLLAHDAEDKQGDDIITRPDVQGGSKQEVVKVADAVGYLYQTRQGTILDFNATDKWIGKNCGAFEPFRVPDFNTDHNYLASIIANTKAHLNEQSESQKQAAQEIAQWQADVQEITSTDALSKLVETANNHPQRNALRKIIWNHAKAMGWDYDKKKKQFFVPKPEVEDTEDENAE